MRLTAFAIVILKKEISHECASSFKHIHTSVHFTRTDSEMSPAPWQLNFHHANTCLHEEISFILYLLPVFLIVDRWQVLPFEILLESKLC